MGEPSEPGSAWDPENTIDPSHEVVFGPNDSIRDAAFSRDGETVFCLIETVRVDLVAAVVGLWPEILGGLLIAVIAIWILVTSRVLRRRQSAGSPHCRRCNYLLAHSQGGPDAASSAVASAPRCPECGVDLSRTPARRGRSTFPRLALPSSVVLICILGYSAMHVAGVPRLPNLPAWTPGIWSDRLDEYAASKKNPWLLRHRRWVNRIMTVNAVSGSVCASVLTSRHPLMDIDVAPDGTLVAVQKYPDALLWIRPSDGAVRKRIACGDVDVSNDSIIGFDDTPRGLRVYYCGVVQAEGRSRLMQWCPSTGHVAIVMDEAAFCVPDIKDRKLYEPKQYALLLSKAGTSVVISPGMSERFSSVRDASSTHRISFGLHKVSERGEALTPPTVVETDLTLVTCWYKLFPGRDERSVFGADFASGVFQIDTCSGHARSLVGLSLGTFSDRLAVSPDQTRLLVGYNGSIQVYSLSEGHVQAALTYCEFDSFIADPAARRVAVPTYSPRRQWQNMSQMPTKLLIFDLTSLDPATPLGKKAPE